MKNENKKTLVIAIVTIGFTSLAMAQVPTYVPTSGLIGWWPFNGNANDESGNGNHATVNGAVLANDRFSSPNSAYFYNGINAYLNGNASNFPTGNRTIGLWFYSTVIDSGSSGLQIFGYGGGLCGESFLLQMDNGSPSTNFLTEDSYEVSIGCNIWLSALPFNISTPSPNNNWHHLVITNGITGVDTYIDGVYKGGITTPISGTGVSGKNFFIGTCPDSSGLLPYQDNYNKNWNGLIDDIGIWDRALTQQEITALYTGGGQVGINSIDLKNSLTIYPNPSKDVIEIKLNEPSVGMSYTLFDVLGRAVIIDRINQSNFLIDISNFAPGVYYLHVEGRIKQVAQIVKE